MKIYVSYDEIKAGEIFYEDENGKYVIRSKTRADFIRSMSDEELAELFSEKTGMRYMSSIWLDWLKQEVE